MRTGRVEEAGALSVRIGQAIQNCCRGQMRRYNGKTDAGGMWAAVRRLTGRQQPAARVDGITAMIDPEPTLCQCLNGPALHRTEPESVIRRNHKAVVGHRD